MYTYKYTHWVTQTCRKKNMEEYEKNRYGKIFSIEIRNKLYLNVVLLCKSMCKNVNLINENAFYKEK